LAIGAAGGRFAEHRRRQCGFCRSAQLRQGDQVTCGADRSAAHAILARLRCDTDGFHSPASKPTSAMMHIGSIKGSVDGLRRKLRAVAAVLRDPAATENEKAVAAALQTRLKRRLRDAGAPKGDWTDQLFRLGRWAKKIGQYSPPGVPEGDWTANAHRLGRALRRSYKSWRSD
jgi:hypothetical protein